MRRLRSHHAIDSEMEREIKGKKEMKKRKNTKNDRMEKIEKELRVRRDRTSKY